ncbi:MAG: nitrilase-related carbon-nitrogen hydrolase, partial [Lysobacterales bacterium]
RDTDKLAIAEAPGRGPIQQFLADAARRHGLTILGGTLPVVAATSDDGANKRVLNRSYVYAPDGSEAAHYDKLHLFAFDNGRESYDEGRTLAAGSEPRAVHLTVAGQPLRLGLSICYDLRFPELYRALKADVLLVPSAFTYTTGQAHWEVLLRARAIENLAYVVAPAQGGVHENARRTWGHSMLVDPWGQILAQHAEGAGVVMGEVLDAELQGVRRRLSALDHRVL